MIPGLPHKHPTRLDQSSRRHHEVSVRWIRSKDQSKAETGSPITDPKKLATRILFGFTRQERVSINIEKPGLLLASRFPECIMRLTDLNVYESDIYQHHPPAFARKAAGDSSSPKIDIAYRAFRHRLTISDIAEL